MDEQQNKFEGWAIVELMGHQREFGYVTTEVYGQAVLFRVDQPGIPVDEAYTLERPEWVGAQMVPAGSTVQRPAIPARSRLVSPNALYAINPCDEAAAIKALLQNVSRPLVVLKLADPPEQLMSGDAAAEYALEVEDDWEAEQAGATA